MNRDSGRHFLDMVAPALAFAAMFLLLRAANQTPDGLSYAVAVRTGVDMWHPHHLVYVPVARMVHQIFGVGPITATLLQNLFWVVVLALAARRLAGRIFSGRLAPIVAVAGLLALRGVMIYSVRVETYLPALACLTVATALALERPVRPWLLAPVLALAILYHQTNVLFVVPLMVLFAEKQGREFLRPLVALAAATALVLVAYIAVARQAAEGFWSFALNYVRAPIEAWGNFDYYSLGGMGELAASQVRMILPVRDAFAVPGGVAFLVGLVLLVVWHFIRIRRQCGHLQLRLFSLVFLAVYFLFFLWWMPSDTDFFVATLLPLWLLVLILINDLPTAWKRPPVAMVLVGFLFLGNLIFTILPMHRDPGPGRRLALALDAAAPSVAELVVGYAVQQELLYFTPRTRVHEGDALARDFWDGRAPWSRFGPAEAMVVIDGIFLRELLERGDPASGLYLEWLTGFDPDSGTSLEARRLATADGIQLGPGRVPAGSPNAVVANIRALSRP